MVIGKREFETGKRTYVMGILNVTPDSFSDGGKYAQTDEALRHVERMIGEGADLIDIGGESTRPGYEQVGSAEEIERTAPVIRRIRNEFDIPVSLDTYKSEVALAGIEAGADLINDIWGLKADARMAGLIAESGLPCCLMHNRRAADYQELMQDMAADLAETLRLAGEAGIAPDRILLDPGIGFGKSYEDNLTILGRMEELHSFGFPLLLGASRKSVIGLTLQLPVDERLEGTLATTVLAVMKGVSFVRVHDVKENVRAIRMTEAVLQYGK